MRILTVDPGFDTSVADVHRGWTTAFRKLGHEVRSLNLSERIVFYTNAHIPVGGHYEKVCSETEAIHNAAKGIEIACYEFWPDLVFITSAHFMPQFILELLRARGHKIVLMLTEEPYELDRELKVAPYADIALVNDPTHLDRFRDIGRAEYQWHCYDPEVHYPRGSQPDLASDFCFVGTGFPSRVEFFEKVDWTGIDACFAGTWNALTEDSPLRPFVAHDLDLCVDNDQAAQLYCSTKLSANLYRTESQRPELSEGWSCGPREIELAATETFFLRQRRGEGDALFPHLPTFETPAELTDLLRYWLERPDERQALARQARAAIAVRTFAASASRLLGWLS